VNSSNAGCRNIQVVNKTVSNESLSGCEHKRLPTEVEMPLGDVCPRDRERVFQGESYGGYLRRLRFVCLRGFVQLRLGFKVPAGDQADAD